jgi:hypothetical protein
MKSALSWLFLMQVLGRLATVIPKQKWVLDIFNENLTYRKIFIKI